MKSKGLASMLGRVMALGLAFVLGATAAHAGEKVIFPFTNQISSPPRVWFPMRPAISTEWPALAEREIAAGCTSFLPARAELGRRRFSTRFKAA